MKPIPKWKYWLSNFVEIPLESAASEVNPDLKLGLRKGRLCLSTPNAIYSYDDLYDNFLKTFQQINLEKHPISDVLVLGFGMGSIPYILEKVFAKKYNYVGVELDEAIVQWASEYTLPKIESPVQVQVADAKIFAKVCPQKFDLICMDIFLDNKVPEAFEDTFFLLDMKNLLNENGLLLFNRMTFGENDKKATQTFFEEKFRRVFPHSSFIDLGGNWMLIAHHSG